jgi:hypothetical protein
LNSRHDGRAVQIKNNENGYAKYVCSAFYCMVPMVSDIARDIGCDKGFKIMKIDHTSPTH